jgi:hypothetical protein
MLKRFSVLASIVLLASSCSLLNRTPKDELAILVDPVTIQEDNWQFKYTTLELPGGIIRDSLDDEYRAAGQWAVINLAATNTSDKKQESYIAMIDKKDFILITSDGQKWEYPKEIYDYRIATVQPDQSYNLKLAFDIPTNLTPKTLIYQFYDEDYNTLEFEIPLQ